MSDDHYTYMTGDGRFNMKTPSGWQAVRSGGETIEATIGPDGGWVTVDAQDAEDCWAFTELDGVARGKYGAVLPATRFLLAPRAIGLHSDDDPSGSVRTVRVEVGMENSARMLMFQGLALEPIASRETIEAVLTLQDGEFRRLTFAMKDLTDALLANGAVLSAEQRAAARELRKLEPVTVEVVFSHFGDPVTISPPSVGDRARC